MQRMSLPLVCLLLAAACGGGGDAPPPPGPVTVDLGRVSSSAATLLDVPVTNDTGEDGQVVAVVTDGPLSLLPDQLPLPLAAGAQATLRASLLPLRSGPVTASAVLDLQGSSGATAQRTVLFTAQAEPVSLGITPTALEFGDVTPGTTLDLPLTVRNLGQVSAATVFDATFSVAGFTIQSPALPLALAPGASSVLTVRYAPTSPGVPQGTLTLRSNATSSPHVVPLGAASGGEQIIDLGTQTFDGQGNTDLMTFDVPADAIGFMIEGITNPTAVLGLRLLTGPGGEEFENEQLNGPYFWYPGQEIFTAMVPNTDRPAMQIPAGGGTWSLKLFRYAGSASQVDVRVIVERRPTPGTEAVATLDLNVFLANAISPTAATAANDTALQTVIGQIDALLAQQGIRVGQISYYDVTDPAYDDVTEAEFGPMLTLSSAASAVRLNLFFVRTAIGGGILGVSPALGGPPRNGTQLSGVMSLYSTSNPAFIGLVATHEIGHFVGLAHTQEMDGTTYDDILDTDECPACTGPGGGYLMHWQAVGGTTITDGQGLVIRGHPHMAPAPPPAPGALSSAPKPLPLGDVFAPQDWCGTCQRIRSLKGR